MATDPSTHIRRSFRCLDREQLPALLAQLAVEGFSPLPEPFWELAFGAGDQATLSLGSSLAATFGHFYIQDRSSMLPPLALNPPPGARVLDICASPGSKTGLLATLVGPSGFVLANEPSRERLSTLRRNLLAQNLVNTATCSHPGEQLPLPSASFEYIQLDPPCSGWGTAEKHPKVTSLWTGAKVAPLVALQRQLLVKAAELLAPGGTMVYSTCTTNPEENGAQVRFALDELGLELVPLTPFPGFEYEPEGAELLEGTLSVRTSATAQGFYLAKLRKPDTACEPTEQWNDLAGWVLDLEQLERPEVDLSVLPDGEVRAFGENIYFLHEEANLPARLGWQGFPLGKLKKTKTGQLWRVHPLLRLLATPEGSATVDDPALVRSLLAGRSLNAATDLPGQRLPAKAKQVALALTTPSGPLPLCWLDKKGARLVYAQR